MIIIRLYTILQAETSKYNFFETKFVYTPNRYNIDKKNV